MGDALIGQVVGGRYEIVRLIGKGGMGAIYEVRNTRVGRSFAMKTLIGDAADDSEVLARFRREADVVARIKHPNIVEVVDWESLPDGSPCIILEYLDGENLGQRIREAAPMPWLFVARVADQLLSALSVAHGAGIVHRDLKPQNVFLALDDTGDERAKLLDFGVSKIRDSRSFVTTDMKLLGTPAYMSPEQAEGRRDDIGPQADLWAMGAILYEMATGELAFEAESLPAVLYRICSKDAESVDKLRPDAPPAFVRLVRDAMQRDLDKRVANADEMRVRLREALADVVPPSRYSDKIVIAPPRRKRYTGATDVTVSSGHDLAIANTVQSGAFSLTSTPTGAGESISPTLARRRRFTPLAVAFGLAASAAIVVTIVMVATRDPEVTLPAPISKQVEPAADVAVAIDAAIAAAPIDAPPDAATTAPPRIVRKKPEVKPPPVPVIEVKPPPPKGKCDHLPKQSREWLICDVESGGGN